MSEYHNSDSSDDDVCFGPYTINEAKKDWHKYHPRKIDRRHTTYICKLQEGQKNLTQGISNWTNPCEENTNSSDTNKKLSSEYLTANESMSTDRLSQNSDFLEKLTKVINDPVSGASSYNTAFDRTDVFENINDNFNDDTFLARFKNQTTFALDNVHHTLVENTVLPPDDSFNKPCNYENKNCKEYNPEEINDSVISISDESLKLDNSAYESDNLDASRSPILSKDVITFGEKFSKAIINEEFGINRDILNKDQLIDHTDPVYEGCTDQPENKNYYSINFSKSSSDFKNLSISDTDTEPKDYSCNIQLRDSSDNLSDSQEFSENSSFESLQRFDRVIVDCNQLSKISEKTEFTTCIEGGSSMNQQDDSSGVSSTGNLSDPQKLQDLQKEDKQEYIRSAVPDVHSNNFSSSSDVYERLQVSKCSEASTSSMRAPSNLVEQSNESYQFDDTLEEINRFLEQGVDYEMPEITHSKTTPLKEPFNSNHIISGSFMNNSLNSAGLENKTPKIQMLSVKSAEKCKVFYSAEKVTKPLVKRGGVITTVKPRSQELTCKFPSKSSRSLFTKNTEMKGDFKVPMNPGKKLPTPSKLPKPLKNIVSPVGVYIKHSPKYCPMIKVSQNTGTPHTKISKLLRPDSTLVKENIPCALNQEIPKVIYRPAQQREIKEENDVVLPGSIKKLIKEQVVTKHEHRIQDDKCNQSIERRLMESDLSLNLSHNNQDISILTNKQPFHIKRF